jgi:hypothetical protein
VEGFNCYPPMVSKQSGNGLTFGTSWGPKSLHDIRALFALSKICSKTNNFNNLHVLCWSLLCPLPFPECLRKCIYLSNFCEQQQHHTKHVWCRVVQILQLPWFPRSSQVSPDCGTGLGDKKTYAEIFHKFLLPDVPIHTTIRICYYYIIK